MIGEALSALLFLYREVLGQEVPWLDGIVHAKRPRRLPVVLTREEVQAVLGQLNGVPHLMALLLYGAGLRLLECARLRVKDIDFTSNQIVVRTAWSADAEVPERGQGVGLAVGVPGHADIRRPVDRPAAPAPPA